MQCISPPNYFWSANCWILSRIWLKFAEFEKQFWSPWWRPSFMEKWEARCLQPRSCQTHQSKGQKRKEREGQRILWPHCQHWFGKSKDWSGLSQPLRSFVIIWIGMSGSGFTILFLTSFPLFGNLTPLLEYGYKKHEGAGSILRLMNAE